MIGSTDNPRLATVLEEAIRAGTARMHTAAPATIVSYDATSQKAVVQLAVRPWVQDPDTLLSAPAERPTAPIPNVPVLFPGGNNRANSITWPLVPGDPVLLVIAERSTDEYRTTGQPDNKAQVPRRFDLSDAVAIPGFRSFNAAAQTGPLPAAAVDASALVLRGSAGSPVKLGNNTATEAAFWGTTFETRLGVFMAAFSTYITAVSTATTVAQIAAAALTFKTAVDTFTGQVGTHQSLVVKVA